MLSVSLGVVFVVPFVVATQAPGPIARETLGNGFEILSLVDATAGARIAGTLYVRCGRLDEIEGQEGAADLLADTWIDGGSEKTSGEELEAWLGEHDASLGVAASTDHVSIDFQCASADLAGLYAKLGELVATPRYPESSFLVARDALADACESDEVELEPYRVLERFALGPGIRAGRAASRASVLSIERDELVFFHRAYLVPDRMLLGLSGAIDAQALAATRAFAEALPALDTPARDWSTHLDAPKRTTVLLAPGDETHVWIVAPAPSVGEADFALLAHALAGQNTFMVPPEIAERRRSAGVPRADPSLTLVPSEWLCSAVCVDATIDPARAANALKELATLFTKGSFSELAEDAKAAAANPHFEAPMSARARVERALLDSIRAPENRKLAIAPTAADLGAAAERWIDPKRLWVFATGPVDRLRAAFASDYDVLILDSTLRVGSTQAGLETEQRLFAAMGGVERWAKLASLATEGDATLKNGETIRTRQVRDIAGFRLWQEQTRGGAVEVTVLDATAMTTVRGNTVLKQPSEMQARVLRRSACHLYQVLHDLARGAGRGVRVGEDGLLEVLRPEGLLCWIALDANGRPQRLGWSADASGDGATFEYSDWKDFDGFPYPSTVAQPEAGVRTTTSTLTVDGALDEGLFRRGQAR
ncbi:MAG: hypothetical protein K8S98_16720 [Planctomycetes bacterium]|nr:hypothetical protein [Planctomycetota bacterium]